MSDKTVFVLGAGASSQFGFPTGLELLKKVINDTASDRVLFQGASGHTQQQIEDFREALYFSGLSSVDAFLQFNEQYQPVGKFLIGWHIAKHENERKLLMISEKDIDVNREPDRKSWYRELWRHFVTRPDVLVSGKVTFLTFNYDRSLEKFLQISFQHSLYGGRHMDAFQKEALERDLAAIKIVHAYGQLGLLPWQPRQEGDLLRPYEPQTDSDIRGFWATCQKLDLVRSGARLPAGMEKARHELRTAARIFFLGFGFDETNMELLGAIDGVFSPSQVIGGTTLGLGQAEVRRIENYFSGPKDFAPLPIEEYLREKIDWSSIL